MSASEKVKKATEDGVREFVSGLSKDEQKLFLVWSEKAVAIRENSKLSSFEKVRSLSKIENGEVARLILLKCLEVLRNKVWTNQSWARRLGFAGIATGLTFGGASVGIATMGAGMGVPLVMMTAAGGVILGAAIDEMKRELKGKNSDGKK